jgi:hypothetical protein
MAVGNPDFSQRPVVETRNSLPDLKSGASRQFGVRLTVWKNLPRAPLGQAPDCPDRRR